MDCRPGFQGAPITPQRASIYSPTCRLRPPVRLSSSLLPARPCLMAARDYCRLCVHSFGVPKSGRAAIRARLRCISRRVGAPYRCQC